jgi:hypothetical protein
MTPHLFLDFDGVLHPSTCAPERLFERAEPLAAALRGVACEVVISSSWRHHHPLPELLQHLPHELAERVIGHTGPAYVGRWARWHEIEAWRALYARGAPWRALDDSTFEFPPQCVELIACDPNLGIAVAQAKALRTWAIAVQAGG